MVPPQKIRYFFSVHVNGPQFYARDQHHEARPEKPTYTEPQVFMPPKTNIIHNLVQTRHFIDKTYLQKMSVYPRPEKWKPLDKSLLLKPAEPVWSVQTSIFKEY